MEALLAFYVGWTMGARSGPSGVEELNDAFVSLRESEEFGAFLVVLRRHLADIMRQAADQVEGVVGEGVNVPDVLATVFDMFNNARQQPEE